jgi:putative protease
VAYLLSPKDLTGIDHVARLAELGVAALKIEGRLKAPHYVATTVAQYRAAAAAAAGEPAPAPPVRIPTDELALHIAYSRGVSPGFLDGADHQTLVEGRFPNHRGVPLGRVAKVSGDSVLVVPDPAQRVITGGLAIAPGAASIPATDPRTRVEPRAGMGVVFDRGRPGEREEGGPIFSVSEATNGTWLKFGRPGPNLAAVRAGDRVWVTSDPRSTWRCAGRSASRSRSSRPRAAARSIPPGLPPARCCSPRRAAG